MSLRNLYNLSDEHISTKKRQSISQSVNQSQITVFIMLIINTFKHADFIKKLLMESLLQRHGMVYFEY